MTSITRHGVRARWCGVARCIAAWVGAAVLLGSVPAFAQPTGTKWVASWAQAMTSNFTRVTDASGKVQLDAWHNPREQAPALHDATLRQVVHLSIGGDYLRVRLSNYFGQKPLVVSGARVALPVRTHTWSFTTNPETGRTLTFGGKSAVTIAPGQIVVSDPVHLHVPALANLIVSMYFAGPAHLADMHPLEHAETALAVPGNALDVASLKHANLLGSAGPKAERADRHIYVLSEVDVIAPRDTRGIVTFGDSITDSWYAGAPNKTWPADLSALANGVGGRGPAGVANASISGNELLVDQRGVPDDGPSGLKRFERDVIDRAGVTDVVVLIGGNDLDRGTDPAGYPSGASYGAMVAGFRMLIDVAHAHHLKIYAGTITPFAGFPDWYWYSPKREIIRERLNHWMRTSGAFDGVIDFSRAIAGPYTPSPVAARQHPLPPGIADVCTADHGLHPDDRGYTVMGVTAYDVLFDAGLKPAQPCHAAHSDAARVARR